MSRMLFRLLLFSMFLLFTLLRYFAVNAGASQSPFFWGVALEGYPITDEILEKVEKETQLFPQIVVFFLQWPSSPKALGFPRESLEAIWKRGAVPCVTWEPLYYQDGKEIMVSYERILNGEYDSYLTAFAESAKSWGKPFIIRFAHEMNLERYHWGTDKTSYGPRSPKIYKLIFRYLVSLFRKTGTNNVLWAFCPNAESVPNTSHDPTASWNHAYNYYPGDSYVDILGMDGYNWGTTKTREKDGWDRQWKSFRNIFYSIYKELKELSPTKPLFVFETALAAKGEQKSLWIQEALETLREWNVQGMVWFQAKKEKDWRINSQGNTSYLSLIRLETSCSQQWIKSFVDKD